MNSVYDRLDKFVENNIVRGDLIDKEIFFDVLNSIYVDIQSLKLVDKVLYSFNHYVGAYFHFKDNGNDVFYIDVYNNKKHNFEIHRMFNDSLSAVSFISTFIKEH